MRSHLGSTWLPAILLAATFGLTALPAAAQETPTAEDLRALIFYIENNETAAIQAELRRLRIEFPGWTPPDDLSELGVTAQAPEVEVDDIYAAIARGDVAAARRLIDETRTRFPGWTPPQDMQTLLATADASSRFDEAIAGRDSVAALRIAVDNPELLRCNRINNPWRLAELQEATGNPAAALATYRQIIASCSAPDDLIATIEKANSVATTDQINALIASATARNPAASDRLEQLRRRLLAGRGIALPTPQEAPRTATAPDPAPTPRAVPTAPATTPAPQPAPAAAPAPRAPAPAATAAAPAPAATPTGAVAPGTPAVSPLSTLRSGGDGRLAQVRAAAQAADFRTCAARSASPQSIEVAYERAWCVYNLERPLEALALFSLAANSTLGGTVRRDARYGMALSYLKRNMTDAASEIAASTDLTLEQRRTIEGIILDQRGVRAYQEEDYGRAIVYFDGLEELDGTLRRDLAILRAYAYLNSGDVRRAREEFQRLDNELRTEETRAGLAAARTR